MSSDKESTTSGSSSSTTTAASTSTTTATTAGPAASTSSSSSVGGGGGGGGGGGSTSTSGSSLCPSFLAFVRLFQDLKHEERLHRKALETQAKDPNAVHEQEPQEEEDVTLQAEFFFTKPKTVRSSRTKRDTLAHSDTSSSHKQLLDNGLMAGEEGDGDGEAWQPPTPSSSPSSPVPCTASTAGTSSTAIAPNAQHLPSTSSASPAASTSAGCSTAAVAAAAVPTSPRTPTDRKPLLLLPSSYSSCRTGSLDERERIGKRRLVPKIHILPGEPGAGPSCSPSKSLPTSILIPKKRKRLELGVRVPDPVPSPRPAAGPYLSCASFRRKPSRPVRVVIDINGPDAPAPVVKTEQE